MSRYIYLLVFMRPFVITDDPLGVGRKGATTMAGEVSAASAGALDVHVTGRRILATVVDTIVLGVLFAVLAALLSGGGSVGPSSGRLFSIGVFPSLGFFLLAMVYYIVLEGYTGQTLGKKLLGIKVVREDTGAVPGVGAATIRSVLRLVDGLFGYLVAFIAVLASRKNQRLGDMAARTLVVRD
jgi:uncharacterized RDD family membrane protein YckC